MSALEAEIAEASGRNWPGNEHVPGRWNVLACSKIQLCVQARRAEAKATAYVQLDLGSFVS